VALRCAGSVSCDPASARRRTVSFRNSKLASGVRAFLFHPFRCLKNSTCRRRFSACALDLYGPPMFFPLSESTLYPPFTFLIIIFPPSISLAPIRDRSNRWKPVTRQTRPRRWVGLNFLANGAPRSPVRGAWGIVTQGVKTQTDLLPLVDLP
jgi:hypothetical protein